MKQIRIIPYDVSKAAAFFCMVFINFWALVYDTIILPEWINQIFFFLQGKAAATFIILAGISLSLSSKNIVTTGDPISIMIFNSKLRKRTFFLFTCGLLNSIIWLADILHFYAVFLFIGSFLIFSSNKKLFSVLIFSLLVFLLIQHVFIYERHINHPGFQLFYFVNPDHLIYYFLLDGCYSIFPWFSFFIFGMLLGRMDISQSKYQKKIFLFGLTIFVTAEILSLLVQELAGREYLAVYMENILPWFVINPWEPNFIFVTSAGASGFVFIAFISWFCDKFQKAQWMVALVYTGQTTLTFYILHIIIGTTYIQFFQNQRHETLLFLCTSCVLFFSFMVISSYFWVKRYKKGPLELLLHFIINQSFFHRNILNPPMNL
jgi:uncharacterized membrane protein YeiB